MVGLELGVGLIPYSFHTLTFYTFPVICSAGFCRHDFNIAVLKAFVNLSDFAGMILVQALRLV